MSIRETIKQAIADEVYCKYAGDRVYGTGDAADKVLRALKATGRHGLWLQDYIGEFRLQPQPVGDDECYTKGTLIFIEDEA